MLARAVQMTVLSRVRHPHRERHRVVAHPEAQRLRVAQIVRVHHLHLEAVVPRGARRPADHAVAAQAETRRQLARDETPRERPRARARRQRLLVAHIDRRIRQSRGLDHRRKALGHQQVRHPPLPADGAHLLEREPVLARHLLRGRDGERIAAVQAIARALAQITERDAVQRHRHLVVVVDVVAVDAQNQVRPRALERRHELLQMLARAVQMTVLSRVRHAHREMNHHADEDAQRLDVAQTLRIGYLDIELIGAIGGRRPADHPVAAQSETRRQLARDHAPRVRRRARAHRQGLAVSHTALRPWQARGVDHRWRRRDGELHLPADGGELGVLQLHREQTRPRGGRDAADDARGGVESQLRRQNAFDDGPGVRRFAAGGTQGRLVRNVYHAVRQARRLDRQIGDFDEIDPAAGTIGQVYVAGLILPEGADLVRGLEQRSTLPDALLLLEQAPEPTAAIVAVEEHALQPAVPAAVYVAARDRTSLAMVVLGDRRDQSRRVARSAAETLAALHGGPPVVFPPGAVDGLKVDLLHGVLADIRDIEITAQAIEAEAPRMAQT